MKKILVVDDDESILHAVGIILSKSGFEILTDITGLNTAELVNSFSPDVILLDILLPGKSGTNTGIPSISF